MSTTDTPRSPEPDSTVEAYRLLFEQAGEMVCTLDLEGRFTSVNPAGERLTGYAAADLIGRLAIDVVAPELREQATHQFQDRLRGDAAPDETVLITRQGQRVPVLATSTMISSDGRAVGVLGLISDLTPRRSAERAVSERLEAESHLRDAEARFRSFFESAPIGEAIVAPDGRFLEVNSALCQIVGYSESELRAKTFQVITHPDDLGADLEFVRQMLAGAIRTYQMEKRYLHKNGQIVWALLTVSLVRSSSDEPRYFISQIQDITERRLEQEAIKSSEALLAEAQRLAHIGSWEWDVVADTVFWSDELYTIFDVDPATRLTYATYVETIHPDDRSKVESEIERAGTDGEPYEVDHRVVRTTGAVRWIQGRGRVRMGPDGPISMWGTAQDITERMDAESERDRLRAALFDAQKLEAIGRLAGGVAHDFNNMLTAIKGYSELLLSGLQPGTRPHHEAEQIRRAAEQASSLPEQLLAFARKQPLEAKLVDINTLVTTASELLRHLIGERIELLTIPAPTPAFAKVDPDRVEQILVNLALNARDAMPTGGVLTITVSTTEDAELDPSDVGGDREQYVVISVADDGQGMDAATRDRAFEPFFTTKPQGKGSGLGLASVHGTVTQSGGSVQLESEPGRGTTVRLIFPAAAAGPAASVPPSSDRAPVALLAEDEDLVRELVASVLEREGFEVHATRNGVEALEQLDRIGRPLDLLVTDLVMPRMGGRELAERVAETQPRSSTVFISGYSEESPTVAGQAPRGSAFVSKPFSPDALMRIVNTIIARSVTSRSVTSGPPNAETETATETVTCVIADDHPAVLDSVSRYLEEAGIAINARASRADDALREISAHRPMIALVDVTMEPFNGIEVARQVAVSSPQTSVVVYTGHHDHVLLRQALEAGARGFVLKDSPLPDLVAALHSVAAGGTYVDARLAGALAEAATETPLAALTKRERQILTLLAGGMTNEKAARELGISGETIQSHVRNAMTKLDADTRTQAVATAIRQALIV